MEFAPPLKRKAVNSPTSSNISPTKSHVLLQDLPAFLHYVTHVMEQHHPSFDVQELRGWKNSRGVLNKKKGLNIAAAWKKLTLKKRLRYQEIASKSEFKLMCPPSWNNLSKTRQHDLHILAWVTPASAPFVELIESRKQLVAWFCEPTETEITTAKKPRRRQHLNITNDAFCHVMKFLTVQDLKHLPFVSLSLSDSVQMYLKILSKKETFEISKKFQKDFDDSTSFSNLDSMMEMLQVLSMLPGYDSSRKVVLELEAGVYEVVGSCVFPAVAGVFDAAGTCHQTLSVSCVNLLIVGKGEGKTTVHGGFAVLSGMSLYIRDLTVTNPSEFGLIAYEGATLDINRVTIAECQDAGVWANDGAKLVATACQFTQNGGYGVYVEGSTTTARLTNCTSHHNKSAGVSVSSGAVVDLMGEGTSVHDNEWHGLAAGYGGTINVYQPCVLNKMSKGNKEQDINMVAGGTIHQKTARNKATTSS